MSVGFGHVVVVTGLSGAGKSTVLNAFEDAGYYCIDNLPTSLIRQAVEDCERGGIARIALGIDVRVRAFLDGVGPVLDRLRENARTVDVFFLDASNEVLLRRFSETRRPHPLASVEGAAEGKASGEANLSVLASIALERERLAPIRSRATVDLDTTLLTVHELRRRVFEHLDRGKGDQHRLRARVVSFGFKFGVPVDADLLFDVRFLDNPHFIPELKPLSGNDAPVRDFVLGNPDTQSFLQLSIALLSFCIPRYEREGKSYLTVGVGCTGGRHRSVAIANALSARLSKAVSMDVSVDHRDIDRTERPWARLDAKAVEGAGGAA